MSSIHSFVSISPVMSLYSVTNYSGTNCHEGSFIAPLAMPSPSNIQSSHFSCLELWILLLTPKSMDSYKYLQPIRVYITSIPRNWIWLAIALSRRCECIQNNDGENFWTLHVSPNDGNKINPLVPHILIPRNFLLANMVFIFRVNVELHAFQCDHICPHYRWAWEEACFQQHQQQPQGLLALCQLLTLKLGFICSFGIKHLAWMVRVMNGCLSMLIVSCISFIIICASPWHWYPWALFCLPFWAVSVVL